MRREEFCGEVSGVADALDVDSALGRDGDPRDGTVPQAHPEPRLRVHLYDIDKDSADLLHLYESFWNWVLYEYLHLVTDTED